MRERQRRTAEHVGADAAVDHLRLAAASTPRTPAARFGERVASWLRRSRCVAPTTSAAMQTERRRAIGGVNFHPGSATGRSRSPARSTSTRQHGARDRRRGRDRLRAARTRPRARCAAPRAHASDTLAVPSGAWCTVSRHTCAHIGLVDAVALPDRAVGEADLATDRLPAVAMRRAFDLSAAPRSGRCLVEVGMRRADRGQRRAVLEGIEQRSRRARRRRRTWSHEADAAKQERDAEPDSRRDDHAGDRGEKRGGHAAEAEPVDQRPAHDAACGPASRMPSTLQTMDRNVCFIGESTRERALPFAAVEADEDALLRLDHRTADRGRVGDHQRDRGRSSMTRACASGSSFFHVVPRRLRASANRPPRTRRRACRASAGSS